MNLFYVSDEMLQMVANGKELNLPDEISINDIAEFSASKLIEARQRIRELEEAQRWIPVSERLPENSGRVFIHMGNKYEVIASLVKGKFINDAGSECSNVTHWRPLPEPPEEK